MNHAFSWTLGLTALLVLPLGASFIELVQQRQLQAALNNTLVRRTITVGQPEVELLNTKVNWAANPPIVYLNVRAETEITPKQVRLVQEFISREMEQSFKLVFLVGQVHEVTAEGQEDAQTAEPPPLDAP